MESPRFHLTEQDLNKWTTNFIIFSMPALLIFLMTLQQKGDFAIAVGAMYSAILASVIDLLKKYISQH